MNDKSRMKGDFHVRFHEKFEVEVLLLTPLRGRELITPSYSIDKLSQAGLVPDRKITDARYHHCTA